MARDLHTDFEKMWGRYYDFLLLDEKHKFQFKAVYILARIDALNEIEKEKSEE